jgi:beta-1,4-N-acetylglucosaminyltransferase
MFRMMRGIKKENYSPRVYVVANTDKHSFFKVQEFEGESKDWEVKYIPRSREVGQSYLTSIFSTLYAMLFSFVLIFRVRPDVVSFERYNILNQMD